jgi:23S rRNA (pseudouridine1915-N3)-methyltransferase
LKLTIVALGHKLPAWAQDAVDTYTKRMPPECRIIIDQLKPEDRASKSTQVVLETEAARIETTISKHSKSATRIVLDERGIMLTTMQLSTWLTAWLSTGESPVFTIGSADGLAPSIKQKAHKTIAVSGFTLPHAMVQPLLCEQLYRAWSITQNHPYHRE